MAGTNRIDTHIFHYLQLTLDRTFINGRTQASQVMMQTNTQHLCRFSVQIKTGCLIPPESTDTEGCFISVGQLISGSYFSYSSI